jgi:hypothetical protein
MKNMLVISAALALSVATAYTVAQTSTPPSTTGSSGTSGTTGTTGATGTTGMSGTTGNAAQDSRYPPAQQQNDQNLQRANNAAGQATPVGMQVTDFDTLDTAHSGYLTRDASRNDPWLSQHFASCDTNGNGQVTRSEYTSCSRNGR